MKVELIELLDNFVQNYCAEKYDDPYDENILNDEILNAVDLIQDYLEYGE